MIREVVDNLLKLRQHEQKDIRNTVRTAVKELEKTIEDEVWEDFELRFKHVHPEFYRQLNELHPGLTLNERRLCAFLKLNMITKEIAMITGQTPSSIRMARSRLRQKLGLSNSETDLANFIAGL